MRQNGGCGGAVAGDVVGFGGCFFEQLGAHILIGVFQFDFFCNGHTVMGDSGGTIFAVEGNVAALGTEGGCDCICYCVNAIL